MRGLTCHTNVFSLLLKRAYNVVDCWVRHHTCYPTTATFDFCLVHHIVSLEQEAFISSASSLYERVKWGYLCNIVLLLKNEGIVSVTGGTVLHMCTGL